MDGWERLGRRIAVERGRRWRSRAAFARAAGVSSRVVDDLENGRRNNYSDATLGAIEATLGWEPGTAQRVVEGLRVKREADPLATRLMDAWQHLSPDARRLLVEIAERVLRDRP